MKRSGKRFVCAALAVCMTVLVTGCGAYPEMTDEQYNQVVEYASALLLKYSNNGVKKLTYLEPTTPVEGVDALPETAAETPAEGTEVPAGPEVASLPEVTEETDLPEDPFGEEDPFAEAEDPFAEAEDPMEEGSAVTISQGDKQTLANGLTVGYNGYAVYNYYPIEMADVIISAELGDKLLVLSFTVENPTDEELSVDMVTEDPVFRIAINQVAQGRYRPTILSDDLSTLRETIAPGERKSACLVVEVPEALSKEINAISMSVKYDGKSQTATLN